MTRVRLRLLMVNPNTSRAVTRWLADEARRVAGDRFDSSRSTRIPASRRSRRRMSSIAS